MNNSTVTTTTYGSKRDILCFTHPKAAIGVRVNATGVSAGADGKVRILAGQALQGQAGSLWTDRQTVLSLATGTPTVGNEIYGVTQHDIVFPEGGGIVNANCIFFGFIDPQKMDPSVNTIPAEVRTALEGKVWFIDGNRPQV